MKIHQYIGIVVAKKRFPWLTRTPSLRHAARAWLLLSSPGAAMYFKTLDYFFNAMLLEIFWYFDRSKGFKISNDDKKLSKYCYP